MKTKDLIKRLSEIDPSGNYEVCVGNIAVSDLFIETASRNGWCQSVDFGQIDDDIITCKLIGTGHKVMLDTRTLHEHLRDYPNHPVEIIGQDYGEHANFVRELGGIPVEQKVEIKPNFLNNPNWIDAFLVPSPLNNLVTVPDDDDGEEDDDDEEDF